MSRSEECLETIEIDQKDTPTFHFPLVNAAGQPFPDLSTWTQTLVGRRHWDDTTNLFSAVGAEKIGGSGISTLVLTEADTDRHGAFLCALIITKTVNQVQKRHTAAKFKLQIERSLA